MTVVQAAAGYPGQPRGGDVISGIDEAEATGAHVLQAGTALNDDEQLVTAGGRVLSVTASGADLSSARENAYRALAEVGFDGAQHRTDIARRAADDAKAAC